VSCRARTCEIPSPLYVDLIRKEGLSRANIATGIQILTHADLSLEVSWQDNEFVKGWVGPQLALVSEKAVRVFLRVLEERYATGMDIEAFHGLEMALSRDKG